MCVYCIVVLTSIGVSSWDVINCNLPETYRNKVTFNKSYIHISTRNV